MGLRDRDLDGDLDRVFDRDLEGDRVGVRDRLGIVRRVEVSVYVGTHVGVLDEDALGEDVCE